MKNLSSALKFAVSESSVSEYIPYSHHVTDTIISTRSEYLSIWKIDGRSHQNASQEEVKRWVEELNNLLTGVTSQHLALWSHIVRRKVNEYPEAQFSNRFAREFDQKYRESFVDYNLMVNDIYLTIVYRPVADKATSFFASLERDSAEVKKNRQAECIKQVEEINRAIGAGMGKRYGAENLGIYTHNGYAFSTALEFLGFLVNGEHIRMPVTHTRFGDYLAVNRPHFSDTSYVGEIASINGNRYFGMLDIFTYPPESEPGHMNALLESDFEFVVTHSFTAHSKQASLGFLDRQQKSLVDSNDPAESEILAIAKAKDDLMSGKFFGGDHHGTINVYGPSLVEVEQSMSKVRAMMADCSIIVKPVDSALEAGYWAQLPGNFSKRPRPSWVTSLNFLSFSPFHNFLSGKPNGNPWGEAVTILKTVSSTPLYFNFHYSKEGIDAKDKRLAGNTIITGKTGVGKTVTLSTFWTQAQKFGATGVAFDKDRGMEALIRILGGRYLALRNGLPTGFNPFQMEPTPGNLAFLKRFVVTLASESCTVSHSDGVQIDRALGTLMRDIEKPLRRLSMLVQLLPSPQSDEPNARPTVHARLMKWTAGHDLGWLFDNPADLIDLSSHQLYGFDVTEFLENPETRGPVMMYLIHRTESMIDGRRFMYLFDEFWKPLQDEYFQDLVRNKQKTIRKQNGLCVFATQEVEDIEDSPICSTLVSQCATQIFLPNPMADRKTYKSVFKLTDTEFDIIRGLEEDSRQFMIKQGGSIAVAKLDLKGFDNELLVLSGTPESAQLAEDLANEYGENPDLWLDEFYHRMKAMKDN